MDKFYILTEEHIGKGVSEITASYYFKTLENAKKHLKEVLKPFQKSCIFHVFINETKESAKVSCLFGDYTEHYNYTIDIGYFEDK